MTQNIEVRKLLKQNVAVRKSIVDKLMPHFLMAAALVSVFVTVGIVVTLLSDAIYFFKAVPLFEMFGSVLKPLSANPRFGFLPIISGTIITSGIAIAVAMPLGLSTAIYMTEFCGARSRRFLKPLVELLAGIPTIVYGFFAYQIVTPLLLQVVPGIAAKNALSPGIVMGIMIIPMVASLSEDAMRSVPNTLREGAYALGSTKLEVAFKVVIPAAISGIIASFVLAASRAIGETMIVAIASGSSKHMTLDIMQSMQTMTGYIVEFTSGDASSGSVGYYSLYAVGLLLFVFALAMNTVAHYISKKYRKDY